VDVGLDAGITEGAGEDGVAFAAEHGKAVRRNGYAVAEIAVGAPVEFTRFDVGTGRPNHFESLWITSWPIPSPGMTAMRFFEGFCGSTGENLTQGEPNE